jgi:uncharacterized protein YecT (DUF1311 family)
MLNYPLTNPKEASKLYSANKEDYNKQAQRVLFTHKQCDSLITSYTFRLSTKITNNQQYGPGAYVAQQKNGEHLYFRCVCIPANELINIPHHEIIRLGDPLKFFSPKEFVSKFKKYKLDSLDLNEATYYTIFPMDINPSFDCSKAITHVEKAICRSNELARLDSELFQLYKSKITTNGSKVRETQRRWLLERDQKCLGRNNKEITSILVKLYQLRIRELNQTQMQN